MKKYMIKIKVKYYLLIIEQNLNDGKLIINFKPKINQTLTQIFSYIKCNYKCKQNQYPTMN